MKKIDKRSLLWDRELTSIIYQIAQGVTWHDKIKGKYLGSVRQKHQKQRFSFRTQRLESMNILITIDKKRGRGRNQKQYKIDYLNLLEHLKEIMFHYNNEDVNIYQQILEISISYIGLNWKPVAADLKNFIKNNPEIEKMSLIDFYDTFIIDYASLTSLHIHDHEMKNNPEYKILVETNNDELKKIKNFNSASSYDFKPFYEGIRQSIFSKVKPQDIPKIENDHDASKLVFCQMCNLYYARKIDSNCL
jgi:hypothetical protein